jgi:hypothetical protein
MEMKMPEGDYSDMKANDERRAVSSSKWWEKPALVLALAFAGATGGFFAGRSNPPRTAGNARGTSSGLVDDATERGATASGAVTLKDFDWYSFQCGYHDPMILPYPFSQHVKPRLLGNREIGYLLFEPLATGTERSSPIVQGLSCTPDKLPEAPSRVKTVPSYEDEDPGAESYTLLCSGMDPERITNYDPSLHEKVRLSGDPKTGYTLIESDVDFGITKTPVLEAPTGAACRLLPGFTGRAI